MREGLEPARGPPRQLPSRLLKNSPPRANSANLPSKRFWPGDLELESDLLEAFKVSEKMTSRLLGHGCRVFQQPASPRYLRRRLERRQSSTDNQSLGGRLIKVVDHGPQASL